MGVKSDVSFVILKFGGTSVSSIERWNTIVSITRERIEQGFRAIVVCSALSGISNMLENLLEETVGGDYEGILESIEDRHRKMAEVLGLSYQDLLGEDMADLKQLALGASLIGEVSARLHARILSFGELMSTKLGAAYLNICGLQTAWKDARKFMVSVDDARVSEERKFLAATCRYEIDQAMIEEFSAEKADVVITQGFIAGDVRGETVLLGRGGSDTSAAYFSAKLRADRCEIWTDVPGIFTANPSQIPGARLIKSLNYNEAQEITSGGAKVLHPRCIGPVNDCEIPLYIKCTQQPDMEGTVISSAQALGASLVKAISSRKGIRLISMEAVEMWQQPGFLADAFACFKRHGLSIDLVSTSETNVTASLDTTGGEIDDRKLEALILDLEDICNVRSIGPCALVSLVGQNIRTIMHKIGPALEVFEENKIYLVSLSSSDLNFSVVVDEDQSDRLVRELHDLLIRKEAAEGQFGPSWTQLFGKEPENVVSGESAWWRGRREELIELAEEESPCFVYDEETLEQVMDDLLGMKTLTKIFYAMKANANEQILRKFFKAGINFECVSMGEVQLLDTLFPGIEKKRILFTPNFAPRREYEYAFELAINVTLDNIFPLQAWPELFKNRDVFVRMDPGHGRGHHKHVRTAGPYAKFGVSLDQLELFETLVKKVGARVVGLHAHKGSGIRTSHNWSETAGFLTEVAPRFEHLRVLDLGGGLGIPEKPGQSQLDIAEVDASLDRISRTYPEYELWMEPGRYLVATAGVLLARVTQLKQKGDFHYVGVDAGMNSLIRPALYGAYHEIVNLSRLEEDANFVANIVGPICETGDTFGYSRRLPKPEEGDVLLIATAGAYGRTMSSEYNLRRPAIERFLKRRV